MSRLPTFFIVGAPKAGTTSLYRYLDEHPRIYMSAVKEPHFFAPEVREENFDPAFRKRVAQDARAVRKFVSGAMLEKRFGGIVSDWEDYQRLFSGAGDAAAIGEASTCYLWSPGAPDRIAAAIPNAKIVVLLRDPADRAYSQYLHGVGNGAIRWTFREHIRRNLADRSGRFSIHYPFLELGLYSDQLRRYLDRFAGNVWIGFHDEFRARATEVLKDLCRFLGVTEEFSPDLTRHHLEAEVPRIAAAGWLKRSGLWTAAARFTPKRLRTPIRSALMRKPPPAGMDPADRRYLVDFYRADIERASSLLKRDLGRWLQAD